MRKVSRIALRILGGLVSLILLVVRVSYIVGSVRLRKHYAVAGKAVAVPTDSASLVRGRALATLYGCTGCHTADLGGQTMIDAFRMARPEGRKLDGKYMPWRAVGTLGDDESRALLMALEKRP